MSANPNVVFKTREHPAAPPAPVDAPEPPRSAPATYGMVCDLAEAVKLEVTEPINSVLVEIWAEFDRLKLALSKAQTQLATVAGENEALKLIVEHARASQRGEIGAQGLRGAPGRDGPPGPRGERGAKGERGKAAPVVVAWMPRAERFEVAPVYESGQQGPPIALLSLFQAYDAAVSELEDRDLSEAAQASREIVEREVAAGWAR
jgi:hypothetical protein